LINIKNELILRVDTYDNAVTNRWSFILGVYSWYVAQYNVKSSKDEELPRYDSWDSSGIYDWDRIWRI